MRKVELLSPVGDFECLKAAVQNGANSVYLGASSFSARAKATNFNKDELLEAIRYAKLRNVSVHLALNTLIKNDEFEEAVNLAIKAYNMGVDAIIVQDLGLATYLLENYPMIPLHGSTQMTVHNLNGVKQLESMGFSRVVLSRELSLEDITYIRENTNVELEVFIHGALCISYSGQCLLSSAIGGRSGNRGLCAQPCRLPYEIIEENTKTLKTTSIDKGYLLSPRDNCAIELLPELIKLGIDSFKIEGRMKTPYYVGVVTRVYRKYIDLVLNNISLDNETLRSMIKKNLDIKNEDTGLSDREELTQVFNRGSFSTGHFRPNKNLIFKDKPNNMGYYLGTITHINENKGHLKLTLENTLSVGDKVSINNESYTVSELMIDNKNYETLPKGKTVKIGRMKGKISVGSKVYRIETAKLNKSISPTFKEDKNFKKVKINGLASISEGCPITLKVWSDEGFYKELEYNAIADFIPENAQNKPITVDKIKEQLSKTGSTEFEFNNLEVNLNGNLFLPSSALNELRRIALEGYENLVLQTYTRNLSAKPLKYNNENSITSNNNKKVSLLINLLDIDKDYSVLTNIDKLYIPLKYFLLPKHKTQLINLSNTFNLYIYMPHVILDEKLKNINFKNILNEINIKGFVISHISQIDLVKDLNSELIGNFNLNIYNNFSTQKLSELNLKTITLSPELEKFEINDVLSQINTDSELIVYGKLPVMTNQYCYLGKSNKCYEKCDKKCLLNNKYYLKDRMDFKFRFITDNMTTLTTIYNSKTLSVLHDSINVNNIRIDLLDEEFDEIQNIIDTVKSNNRFEGKDYTNGKLN